MTVQWFVIIYYSEEQEFLVAAAAIWAHKWDQFFVVVWYFNCMEEEVFVLIAFERF